MTTKKAMLLLGVAFLVMVSFILLPVGCATEETTREGYKAYSRYGFSFEYPQSSLLFEEGLLESAANETSGLVYAGVENAEVKYIFIGWLSISEQLVEFMDLETSIEDGLQGMEEGEDIVSVERGELAATTKAGHQMLYRYYNVTTTEGDEASGIFGVWYCDNAQKFYMLYTLNTTISSKGDVLADYQDYLNYFVGH